MIFHFLFSYFRSHSGVLNIYDNHCLTEVRPKPVRAVMNLTTQITASKFNHNSEIVAIASFHTANSVKLVSFQVILFSNICSIGCKRLS